MSVTVAGMEADFAAPRGSPPRFAWGSPPRFVWGDHNGGRTGWPPRRWSLLPDRETSRLYVSPEVNKSFIHSSASLVMIAGAFPRQVGATKFPDRRRSCEMVESLTSGTMAGAGSFRCQRCGYVLTLAASDTLSDCPGCGGASFVRASLFSAGRFAREGEGAAAD